MSLTTADDFRGALGSWASGVTVVTSRYDGLVYGITVSSFASLSLDPMLILVCLAESSRLPAMIAGSGRFAVSVLAQGQDDISSYFAVPGREPVATYDGEIATFDGPTGSPLVAGALAHLDCELHEAVPGGDHAIAVGRVVHASHDPVLRPLVYYRRAYRTLILE